MDIDLIGLLSIVIFGAFFSYFILTHPQIVSGIPMGITHISFIFVIYFAIQSAISIAIHTILRIPLPADIPGWYYHAKLIENGEVPNRDYNSPYSPGFEYLNTLIVHISDNQVSLMIVLNAAGVMAGYLLVAYIHTHHGIESARIATALFMLNPMVLANWLMGQDESLMLLSIVVLLWFVSSKRPIAIALTCTLALFFTKPLLLCAVVPSLMLLRLRYRMISVTALIILLIPLWISGSTGFGTSFTFQSGDHDPVGMITSGNIWLLVQHWNWWVTADHIQTAVALISITISVGIIAVRITGAEWSPHIIIESTGLIMICFISFYHSSLPTYGLVLIPLILLDMSSKSSPSFLSIVVLFWASGFAMDGNWYARFQNDSGLGGKIFWAWDTFTVSAGIVLLFVLVTQRFSILCSPSIKSISCTFFGIGHRGLIGDNRGTHTEVPS